MLTPAAVPVDPVRPLSCTVLWPEPPAPLSRAGHPSQSLYQAEESAPAEKSPFSGVADSYSQA